MTLDEVIGGGGLSMAAVALVGTLDTKGPDFAFLAERLRAAGAEVIVVAQAPASRTDWPGHRR